MTDTPQDAPLDADEVRTSVTIRRAPKFSAFIVVGALIGFLATLVATSLFPADPDIGFAASLGYFSLYGVSIGVLLGAVIALVLDRRAHRRATEVLAGKLEVHDEEESAPVRDSVPNSDG